MANGLVSVLKKGVRKSVSEEVTFDQRCKRGRETCKNLKGVDFRQRELPVQRL